ncbi:MAG: hypothetical protein N2Z65_06525 [Clostridiales bacterium]|nr:hypothetical protein [Clostridiales bacterium]
MYNRYMSTGFDELFTTSSEPITTEFEPVEPVVEEPKKAEPVMAAVQTAAPTKGGGLSSILEKFNMPKFDMDTILLLLVVFFLLSDGGENKGIGGILGENSDLLLIIGLLFILGI